MKSLLQAPILSLCRAASSLRVPSLIGDNADAVIREFRDRADVVHITAPGFAGTSYQGYELFFEAVATQLLRPKPVQKGTINLLGIVPYQHLFWKGALATLKATLAKIGVDANIVFAEFDGIKNLHKLPSAELKRLEFVGIVALAYSR